ncbi:MAG: hypothetical protein R6X35_15515 [Candidatus Krumholzibacteriia bacterium]
MEPSNVTRVIVQDVRMSFGSMVVFMIKWTIASIPAMLILGLIGGMIAVIFGGFFAGLAALAS